MSIHAVTYSMNYAAKRLGVKRSDLSSLLRENNIFTKTKIPHDLYVREGYFTFRDATFTHPGTGATTHYAKIKITGRGIRWLTELINPSTDSKETIQ